MVANRDYLKPLEAEIMTKDWREPIHPGEHLAGELEEIRISGLELSRLIGLPHSQIFQISRGERSITASTALRLGKFFNVDPEFWLNSSAKNPEPHIGRV